MISIFHIKKQVQRSWTIWLRPWANKSRCRLNHKYTSQQKITNPFATNHYNGCSHNCGQELGLVTLFPRVYLWEKPVQSGKGWDCGTSQETPSLSLDPRKSQWVNHLLHLGALWTIWGRKSFCELIIVCIWSLLGKVKQSTRLCSLCALSAIPSSHMACKFVRLITIILPWNYRQSTQWYLKHQLLACSPLLLFLCLCPGLQIHFLHFFQIFWTELWKIAVGTWHFSTMVRVIELCRDVLLGEDILTSNANLKTIRTFSPMGLHKFSTREA